MLAAALVLSAVLGACERERARAPESRRPLSVPVAESFLDDRFRVAAGEPLPAEHMTPVAGTAYFGKVSGKVPGLREGGDGRTLRLVEDGLPLGPPGALSADVVQLGLGRFNHETAARILFSTGDNSDPRTNGRAYRVEWDEPARVAPRSAARTVGIGTTELVVDVATRRPIASRRLTIENLDTERALRVWGRPASAPDLTTSEAMIASVVWPGMSDEEKALALWALVTSWRHHDVAAAMGHEASDPVKLLGVYGFGFCNDASHALAGLLGQAGLPARVSAWAQHTVVEVQLDGSWHLLDPDLGRVYRTESQRLASVGDVFARRAVSVWSPAGPLPLADEPFDDVYPRGTERVHHRPLPPSAHALRPVLEPGDAVVFDFDRGEHLVDRFSYQRSPGWPVRFANGSLRRRLADDTQSGCRVASVAWPYPIVGIELSGHGLPLDVPLVAQIRGDGSEAWQDLRVERIATDATASASAWIEHGPLRYALDVRVCSAGPAELDDQAELLLEAIFQFAPRALPRIGYGANASLWTVEDATSGERPAGQSPSVRITQAWDELDVPSELVVPADGVAANLDPSFFSFDAGFAYTTSLAQQLGANGGVDLRPGASRVAVLENGLPLGPGDAGREEIAARGRGRFVVEGETLRLSASDNTDPRSNGRIYSVVLVPAAGDAPPDAG